MAMGSYNIGIFSGFPSLIVEGIAISPEFQGKGVFQRVTNEAYNGESIVCLRTQNPRMYKALQNYCNFVYPQTYLETPEAIKAVRQDFASYLKCELNENGVIKGYYGGLFYG
jgi:hypothetical protein